MSALDTRPDSLGGDSATLESQRVWKAAGKDELDFASQRLRNRLRSKMFGVDAAPIKIGRYAVLETVGSGGMGVVYAAYDDQLDRRVAVKLLRSVEDDDESSVGRGRLLREAQALAKLSHPNVVQVYEAGTFDGRVFLAMEFLPGPDLRSWLHEGPRDWQEVLRCYGEAGLGLAAAHSQGIIHRDFKPANLLFGADGHVRVVDFGLARAAERGKLAAGEVVQGQSSGAFSVELTQTGEIMGTPAYMSPEQARYEGVDARSDQYSFCVALYEALFGRRPHIGRNTAEVLLAVSEGEVQAPPRNTKVPTRVVRAIMRGLSVEPERRFASIDELLAELSPPRRGGLRWLGGASAVVGLGAFFALGAEAPCPTFDDELAEAWGPAHQQSVHEAFVDSGAYDAEATAAAVSDRLDAYAREWTDARRDACEAHVVRKDLSAQLHDLRVACLLERRAELTGLTTAFGEADETLVSGAREATAELSSIASCDDVSIDTSTAPDDPQSEALRLELAEAQGLYKAGRYQPALQSIDAVIAQATEVGATSVEALAHFHRAVLQQRQRAQADAATSFDRAADLAEGLGDDRLAVRALAGLAQKQAFLRRFDHATETLRWLDRKARRLAVAPDSPLGLDILDAHAVVAWRQEQFDDAIASEQKVLEGRASQLSPGHPSYVRSLSSLAGMLDDAGQHEAARDRYRELHALVVEAYGSTHPRAAEALMDIGLSFYNSQDFESATAPLLEAERIFVSALGKGSPALLPLNKILVAIAVSEGEIEVAHRRAQRILALSARDEVASSHRLDALGILGNVAQAKGDHAGAAEYFGQYLNELGPDPVGDHATKAFIVRVARAQELLAVDESEATAAAEDALRHLEGRTEPFDLRLKGSAYRVIATQAQRQGDNAEAARVVEEALAVWDEPPTDDGGRGERARLQWLLAQVLPVAEATRVRALVHEARTVLTELEPEAEELAEIDAWQGSAAGRRN